MTTPEQIASFIQLSEKKIVHKTGRTPYSITLDNGYFILAYDIEEVIFGKEGEEGQEVSVIELRKHSPWFNDLCKCPDCDDKGGYDLGEGDESDPHECECDNLPFGISVHAKG